MKPSPQVRVILAEDNPGDVYLIAEALRHEHLEVNLIVERDGEKMMDLITAIEAGREPCPDIILLDLNLPRYSGAAVLETLRNGHVCSRTPVVIVTSSDAPSDREIALRFKTEGYFRKSMKFDEFMRLGGLVRSLLGR